MVALSYRLTLGKSTEEARLPARAQRTVQRLTPAKATISPRKIVRALKATDGAEKLLAEMPRLARPSLYFPVATFSVCQKTGTALWLDIWDSDHFDGFTDMQRSLTDCRAWFSANGFTFWDSAQTKTGRVNCYFKAPADGNYVCNAELQSYGGSAQVECLIDNFSYGLLPFTGLIDQPHPSTLSTGYHSFRIRQVSGSYFFIGLTVWKV